MTYKLAHSRHSAEVLLPILREVGWPEHEIRTISILIMNHEIGGKGENNDIDELSDLLRRSDAASSLAINIPEYIVNRGLEAALDKIRLNVGDIIGENATTPELDACLEGVTYYIQVCTEQNQDSCLTAIRPIKEEISSRRSNKMDNQRQTVDFMLRMQLKYGFDWQDPIFDEIKLE